MLFCKYFNQKVFFLFAVKCVKFIPTGSLAGSFFSLTQLLAGILSSTDRDYKYHLHSQV